MNSDFSKIWELIKLDFKIEYRNKYEVYGLLLFVVVTSYILYRATESADLLSFNSTFWVFVLVLSTNFALRSFTKMKVEESRYLYQLVDAKGIIISKLIFNWLLIFSGGIIFFLFGLLFHGFTNLPILDFVMLILLVSLALSSTFSLPSALVMSSSSKGTLLGILSFPISIPLILISINLGNDLIILNEWNINGIGMLTSIILIMSLMSLVLFKFNWQS